MALSEIIINDLVQYQTDVAINEANYQTLRQYLLERKPLFSVTTTINSLLLAQCAGDKYYFSQHLTQMACESQKNSDLLDEQSEQRDKENDGVLHSKYTSELQELDNRLTQLELRRAPQQSVVTLSRNQVDDLRSSLRQVNTAIDRVQNERQLLSYNPQYYPDTMHGHFSTHIEIPNAYPNSYYSYSLQNEWRWTGLFQEETRLKEEHLRLTLLISKKERKLSTEEQNLNTILTEQRQAERRRKELKQQLDIILPNREQQRHIRSQERLAREQPETMLILICNN